MTIRKKMLLILICMSVLPLILITLIRLQSITKSMDSLNESRLNALVQTSASAFSEIIELRKDEISLISSYSSLRDYANLKSSSDYSKKEESQILLAIEQRFKLYVESAPSIYDLALLDSTGRIVAAYNEEMLGYNLQDTDYFQQVGENSENNQVYFSNAHDSFVHPEDPDEKYFAFSKAIWNDNGELMGVIAAYIHLDSMAQFSKNVTVGNTGISFIIDSDNYILYHPEPRFHNSHTAAPKISNLYHRFTNNEIPKQGLIQDVMDGVARVYYYEVIEDHRLVFLVRQDHSEYASAQRKEILFTSIAGSIIGLLAIFMSFILSKGFVKPILALEKAFSSSDGNMYIVKDLPNTVELRDMANSYNDMIQKLEKQFEQLTKEKEKNEYHLNHDRVTGLLNRTAFEKKLEDELSTGATIGIFYLDIDNFKQTNDLFGHPVGDTLLDTVGRRLVESDIHADLYARINSDEFAIAKKGTESEMRIWAGQIQDLFIEPVIIDETSISISISIGIAMYPDHGVNFDTIITNADIAMYQAKQDPEASYLVYTNKMRQKLDRHNSVLHVLKNCVKNHELFLMYQPVYDISGTKLLGYEALSRIRCQQLGILSPLEFVPIAESDCSIIEEVGYAIVREVCHFLSRIGSDFTGYISINLSPLQLNRKGFAENVIAILKECEIRTTSVQFEVKSYDVASFTEEHIENISLLRSEGVPICLDSYNANNSSLHQLMLPYFDVVKINHSLYEGIEKNEEIQLLNRTLLDVAHKFNFLVVVKQLERPEEYDYIRTMDYDRVQGFLFSKPLTENAALELYHKIWTD